MENRLHRCPQCHTVGKVQRSRTRGLWERLLRRILPWYGRYRCHHCNWRGLIPRAGYSRMQAFMMSMIIVVVFLGLVFGLLYYLAVTIKPRVVD